MTEPAADLLNDGASRGLKAALVTHRRLSINEKQAREEVQIIEGVGKNAGPQTPARFVAGGEDDSGPGDFEESGQRIDVRRSEDQAAERHRGDGFQPCAERNIEQPAKGDLFKQGRPDYAVHGGSQRFRNRPK